MPANVGMFMENLSALVLFDFLDFIDLNSIPFLYDFLANNTNLKDIIPLND